MFGDRLLDRLETQIDASNQNVAASLARYDEARGAERTARGDLYPELDASTDAERGRSLLFGDEHDYAGGVSLSYEVDLWGQVRNQVAASRREVAASAADLAAIKLSMEAALAEDYMQLRGQDAQISVLQQTADAYTQALDLTEKRFRGGASSELDVDRARTQLFDAQSQLEQTVAARAQYEHAIAALVGADAAAFTIAPGTLLADPPPIPLAPPSVLLQRRPDVAAAERRVAAANARIGVARAALYPALTLDASAGYEAIAGTLLHASGLIWALGPGALAMPIFDAGKREGEVQHTRAVLAETAADYRQTVLDAFRDVEDQLALANRLARAEDREQKAVRAATRTDALATVQYREGAVDYLQVVVAQTAELDTRRTAISLATRRLIASVDLIRALGGGWNAGAA